MSSSILSKLRSENRISEAISQRRTKPEIIETKPVSISERIKESAGLFRNEPLSGDTLRTMIRPYEITYEAKQTPPVLGNTDGYVTISHYIGYDSYILPQYWEMVLPKILNKYSEVVRYEHHDIPIPSRKNKEYEVATVGRTVYDKSGSGAFWEWFNTIVANRICNRDGAIQTAVQVDDSITEEFLEEAIKYDLYNSFFENEFTLLEDTYGEGGVQQIKNTLDNNDSAFVLAINNETVAPTFDSINKKIRENLSHVQGE